DRVDRVPLSFWLHNFVTENSAAGLVAETLRLARTFDWDFLKPQSRAQCFAEMWGLRYRPSTERATPFTVTHTPLAGAADVARLQPVDPRRGALGEQLAALAAIRAAVGPDTPIIWTVFAPMMVMPYVVAGGREQALGIPRAGNPSLAEVHRRTGRAVVGGLPAKPEIVSMSETDIAARAKRAVDEMHGRALLLGPDCSINPDTPEALLHAAAAVVRG